MVEIVKGSLYDDAALAVNATIVKGNYDDVVEANTVTTSNPPGNCPDGGVWGTIKYVGEKTKMMACLGCLCICLPGLCVLACPRDEKDAYAVNGKVRSC